MTPPIISDATKLLVRCGHVRACLLVWVCPLKVLQSLDSGPCLCRALGNAVPVANILMLEFGSGVMSDLVLRTLLPQVPREEMGKVTPSVTLEVVIEVTDGIGRHGDACR